MPTMQLANVIVRLGGLITNTVPKLAVTPAEILILRRIHGGDDTVVDIRPIPDHVVQADKALLAKSRVRAETEYERLRLTYDNGGGFGAGPGDERKSIMETLFPGAVRSLPMTLADIGIDDGGAPEETPVPVPDIPDTTEPEAEDEQPEAEVAETTETLPETASDGGSAQAE